MLGLGAECFVDNLDNGKSKGACFAGSCFGSSKNVSAAKDERNGFVLDRSREVPSHLGHCSDDLGADAKLFKRLCIWDGGWDGKEWKGKEK